MGRQGPATASLRWVTRRAVMGAKVDDQTIARLERCIDDFVVTGVAVPVRRVRILMS